jgi:hypothetical protein
MQPTQLKKKVIFVLDALHTKQIYSFFFFNQNTWCAPTKTFSHAT